MTRGVSESHGNGASGVGDRCCGREDEWLGVGVGQWIGESDGGDGEEVQKSESEHGHNDYGF